MSDLQHLWTRISTHGNCINTPNPEVFFPPPGGRHESAAAARRICGGCTVRPECVEWALTTHRRHGVWGGLTVKELRGLKREQTQRSVEDWITEQQDGDAT